MADKQPTGAERRQAQDLAYQAMESYDFDEMARLCMEALEIDPGCVDALTMLAAALEPEERVEPLRLAAGIAAQDLGGEDFFRENEGHFWGILETRPFMRALSALAETLHKLGNTAEAITHYRVMLELNPGDNQGVRYNLMGLLFEVGDAEGVRGLLDMYEDEWSAVFAWSELLERLISGDMEGAELTLDHAREVNPHVEAYLLGRKPMPVTLPDYYSPGKESEAVMCADIIGRAWKKYPEAMRWLRQHESPVETTKTKVGRNEPCPCGSGKKYKKCCLGKEEAPSEMPPHSMAGEKALRELHEAMEGRQFASEAELGAFLEEYNRQKAEKQAMAESANFEGLSREQMERLLLHTFDTPGLVDFPEVLNNTPSAPITTLFEMLADAIGEKGLKPTATGNLPRKTTRDIALAYWGEEEYKEQTRFGDLRTELDFFDLHVTRIVSEMAGLIRKYGGKFVVTNKCRKMMKNGGLSAVYPLLLRTFTRKFSWAYWDRFADTPTMQNTWPYTLYLLHRYGDKWRENTFYEDKFLWAFPTIVEEVELRYSMTPENEIRSMYSLRCLRRFAQFLGLVEIEEKQELMFTRVFKLRKTDLLEDAVRFGV